MGNYCASCQFDPKQKTGPRACPFNYLYWDFFARHRTRFAANPRVGMMVRTLDKKPPAEQQAVRDSARAFLDDTL
jgi:deoxyribodipyrimidine photolyase-related protein